MAGASTTAAKADVVHSTPSTCLHWQICQWVFKFCWCYPPLPACHDERSLYRGANQANFGRDMLQRWGCCLEKSRQPPEAQPSSQSTCGWRPCSCQTRGIKREEQGQWRAGSLAYQAWWLGARVHAKDLLHRSWDTGPTAPWWRVHCVSTDFLCSLLLPNPPFLLLWKALAISCSCILKSYQMLEITHLLGKKPLKAQKPFCQRPELNTPVPLRHRIS